MCDSLRGGIGTLSGAAMISSSAESMGMNSLGSSDSGEHSFLGIFFASSVFATFTSLVPCLLGLFVAFCAVCNICEQVGTAVKLLFQIHAKILQLQNVIKHYILHNTKLKFGVSHISKSFLNFSSTYIPPSFYIILIVHHIYICMYLHIFICI